MGTADDVLADDVVDDVGTAAPSPAPTSAPAPTSPPAAPSPAPAPGPDAVSSPAPGPAPAPEDKGIWPENWRTAIAGDDKKLLDRLTRYASPNEVAKALAQVQEKIGRGELRSNLGSKATAEELAAFRKEMGIPETADAYELPKGIPETLTKDNATVKAVMQAAHATNATPQQVQAIIAAYAGAAAQDAKTQGEAADQARADAEAAITEEWGIETKRNLNVIKNFIETQIPDADTRTSLLNAKMPDGVLVGNHPEFARLMLRVALIENPVATLSPAAGNTTQSRAERYNQIVGMMGTKAYTSNEKVQQEYRDLLEAMQKSGEVDANGNLVDRKPKPASA